MFKRFFGAVILAALLVANSLRADEPLLITGAHAHNDYVHTHPLFDALTNGFCSVEADIYLTNGQLLVAHTLEKTQPGRTLQSLYLDPASSACPAEWRPRLYERAGIYAAD